MKRVIFGALVGLVLIVIGIVLLPMSPIPGGALRGDVVDDEISDWSFVMEHRFCRLEISQPNPTSRTVTCLASDGQGYVGCMRCPDKEWPQMIMEEPAARYQAGTNIYPVTVMKVTDPAERQRVWESRRGEDGEPAGPVPDNYWLFKITSR